MTAVTGADAGACTSVVKGLENHLRAQRDRGRKLLAPYVTAGIRDDWLDVVRTIALAGADTIEIGIPFSDPVMDGPIIQAASLRALERGTTPAGVLNDLARLEIDIPIVVMTYYNLVFRFGDHRFAQTLAEVGVSGVILPDLPMEESGAWDAAAAEASIDTVALVAPNTPDDRLARLVDRAQGFVYAVSTLGVTGERATLSESCERIGKRVKSVTDIPVLIGIGISTPEQAVEAAQASDGVIIGAALMRRLLEGASPEDLGVFVASIRAELDAARP